MASNLSPEAKKRFEEMLAKAEPYEDGDPALNMVYDWLFILNNPEKYKEHSDRMMATMARDILAGKNGVEAETPDQRSNAI